MIRNLEQFISSFLSHVNPGTGRRYGDEPALAWIGLMNEAAPYCCSTSGANWDRAWKGFLARRKEADPAGWGDVPEELPRYGYGSSKQVSALYRFFAERERLFAERLRRHVREVCRSQVLLSCSNGGFMPAPSFLVRASPAYDYVDDHHYFDHPKYPHPGSKSHWKCTQENPVRAYCGVPAIAIRRTFGRPYLVTEFNYPGYNRFHGSNGLLFGAAAARQDWDGVWRFEWSCRADTESFVARPSVDEACFDTNGDPILLASERAIAALFLRGDLKPIDARFEVVCPPSVLSGAPFEKDVDVSHWKLQLSVFGWHYRIGTNVSEKPSAKADRSVLYPDAFRREWGVADLPASGPDACVRADPVAGSFAVATPCTCGAFAEGGQVRAGALTVDISGHPATVWATSLDGYALDRSKRILLTHLTNVLGEGARFTDASCREMLRIGRGRYLMANGRAAVTLDVSPGRWRAHVLSSGGARLREVPVETVEGGIRLLCDVASDPVRAACCYELVKE